MNDVLNSVMTGHPIISTIHAKDVLSVPHRMARMVEMSDSSQDYEDILDDILNHIPCYIYLNREFKKSGEVIRYIESIAISKPKERTLEIIYRRKKEE